MRNTATTVSDMIRENATKTPDAPAIVALDRTPLTYRAFDRLNHDTLSSLRAWGIGPHDRVALICETKAEAMVALFSLMGATTAVPINVDATPAEWKQSLTAAQVTAVVVSQNMPQAAALARDMHLPVITLWTHETTAAGSFRLSCDAPQAALNADPVVGSDTAIILMSSGTTGTPKLVPLQHSLVTYRGQMEAELLGITPSDIGMHFRPTHLSAALNSSTMVPLSAGSCISILQEFSGENFFRDLDASKATWYSGGPVYHKAILAAAASHAEIVARSRLRFIRATSYYLEPELMDEIESLFNAPCVARYGGSETGLVCVNPLPPAKRKPGTVGPPTECELQLWSGDEVVSSSNQIGEIVVRGPSVFSGYMNNPELNKTAFQNGWFRTGDLGKRDDDGYVIVCGRSKEQINRGGQKIIPQEVEAALNTHPAVVDCICFAIPHATLGQYVGAAVMLNPLKQVSTDDLKDHLSDRLSRYKIPDLILIRDQFPKGPDGKLKRISAADFFDIQQPPAPTARKTTRRSAVEIGLSAIWCDVLEIDAIADDENFVAAGGDSLRSMQLCAAVEEAFSVTLEPSIVYGRGSCVSGMARIIAEIKAGEKPAPQRHKMLSENDHDIPLRDLNEPCPLTFAQHRLWFLSKADEANHSYNMGAAFRLTGALEPEVLNQSLACIAARHEVLRAYFPIVQGVPTQKFRPELVLDLPRIDIRHLPEAQKMEEVERIYTESVKTPFDLENGPLMRVLLICMAEDSSVLLWVRHHTITDGLSLRRLTEELLVTYDHLRQGEKAKLPPLEIQFGDFAVWQRNTLRGKRMSALKSYWMDQLAEVPTVLNLPFDRPRSSARGTGGAHLAFALEPEIADKVRAFASQNETSVFATLLTVFTVLISRLSRSEDFVIGTIFNGRTHRQTADLVGLFANTVPLRARISDDLSVSDLMKRTQQTVSDAMLHGAMPFEEIVRSVGPSRQEHCEPLVQVIFGFVPKTSSTYESPNLQMERLRFDLDSARFDLSLQIEDDAAGMEGYIEYSTDLFDAQTIDRIAEMYMTVLQDMLRHPHKSASKLSLLSDNATRELIALETGPKSDYPANSTIHELFSEIARVFPDKPAVINGDRTLTYRELDQKSSLIAHQLRHTGLKPQQNVALSGERSPEFIVGVLGILKAGGAYVSIDPKLPATRIEFMLQDSECFACLVQPGSSLEVPEGPVARIDIVANLENNASIKLPPSHVAAENPVTIYYTSGSTGTPKAVTVSHRNIVRLVMNTNFLALSTDDVVLQFIDTSFDSSIMEICASLLNGATLVQVPQSNPSLEQIAHEISSREVTAVFQPSGLFHKMVDHQLDCYQNVKQVTTGADIVSPRHAEKFVKAYPQCRLLNAYGPTENGVITTTYQIKDTDDFNCAVPIGTPISNTTVHVLDEAGQRVPIGVPGELYTGGDGVAIGYLNRPDQTAAAFVPDLFQSDLNARLYRTGDLVRRRSDGEIEFLGRLDDQVKIRGYRIEIGEVELALSKLPSVKHAAVIVQPSSTGRSLTGFWVNDDQSNDTTNARIRASLQKLVPSYMVPSVIIRVDEIPLTNLGKVDRKVLQDIATAHSPQVESLDYPQTPTERAIHDVWTDLLKMENIGLDQCFFESGGDSLQVMEMVFLLSQSTGVELSIPTVFAKSTIRELSLEIVKQLLAADDKERVVR